MLRGLLAGLLSGTALSGVALGAISLMSEAPGKRAPETTTLDVPAGSEFDQQRDDEQTTLTPLEDRPAAESVPQVSAPVPDDLTLLGDADTTPAITPETGEAEIGLDTPEMPQGDSDVAVQGEEPVLPNPQALPPQAPASEQGLSISTVPAQPVLPDAETSAFPEPEATEPESAAEMAPEAPATEPAQDASKPEAAENTVEPRVDSRSETKPEIEANPDSAAAAEPETIPPAEVPPSSTIGDLAPDVTTKRLPVIGDPDATEPEAASPEADDAPTDTSDQLAPIDRFAVPFENPDDKPLMSIILIDNGTSPIGPAALADFPYPISFAIDATRPDAAEIAARYRAAGLEVLAMADLPDTASPQDAEIAVAATLRAVPEAVAVIEGTRTGLQGSRDAAEHLAPILLDSGHGLVMFPKGLDTVRKLIAREGVPAATVFRDFDSEDQDATVIRRFLDQAAFRAGREDNGVIMVGRLRPDTISALLLWGLQDRAASVALAPVSAILTAE